MKPTLLLCNVAQEKMGALRLCAVRMGCRLLTVPPQRQGLTVGELLSDAAGECPTDAPFTEELLVMADLPAGGLNLLLGQLRRSRVSIALKAVVTPTNREWSLARLYGELCRERAALEQGEKAHTTTE